MSLLSRVRSSVKTLFRGDAKESFELAPFGSVPDPGLGGFANNVFRQWMGLYQLVDRMARARGGNIQERPADERMLYIARGLMRYNPYAQGMVAALRNHTLGSRGFKHTPTGPSRKVLGAWLERWKEDVNWWAWEREIYERVHIEGESIMRFFPNEESVELRPIEPEWILAKDGTLEWTFGFYNEPGDVQDVTALYELTDTGEVIDAAEWYHTKSKNSMRADKRGRSDFLATAQLLDDSFKTWRNFLQSEAVRQGVIYFAKQAAGVTTQDIEQAIASESDYAPPVTTNGRRLGEAIAFQYGAAVEYIQDGTEVLAAPAANAQGTMTGVNAGLLAAGRAYHIPLVLMSGDMSANNTLDFGDESPFGTTIKDEQNWYCRHVRALMWRAVEFAVDEGQLPSSVLYDGTNIEVAAERRPGANSLDNTIRAKTLYDDGVISARERATMEGVDYEEQQAQRQREGAPDPNAQPQDGDNDESQLEATEDITVTVHRNGKTFTQRRKGGKAKRKGNLRKRGAKLVKGVKKGAVKAKKYAVKVAKGAVKFGKKTAAHAKKIAGEIALQVNIALHKMSPSGHKLLGALGAILDEPSDMQKFAYNPATSSGGSAAHVSSGDFVKSSMEDAFGVGLSGHLVASIASKVLAHVFTKVKAQLKKRGATEDADGDATVEVAKFIRKIYGTTFAKLGIEGKLPTATMIANNIRKVTSGK